MNSISNYEKFKQIYIQDVPEYVNEKIRNSTYMDGAIIVKSNIFKIDNQLGYDELSQAMGYQKKILDKTKDAALKEYHIISIINLIIFNNLS